MIVSDAQGNVVAVNAMAEDILGLSRQRVLGYSLISLKDHIVPSSKIDWQAKAQYDRPLEEVFEVGDKTVHVDSAPV
jgi:PAS domain S-box-containing protein